MQEVVGGAGRVELGLVPAVVLGAPNVGMD